MHGNPRSTPDADYDNPQYRTYDAPMLLASQQALVMYTILMLFPTNENQVATICREYFERLQEMSYYVASTGMVLVRGSSRRGGELDLTGVVDADFWNCAGCRVVGDAFTTTGSSRTSFEEALYDRSRDSLGPSPDPRRGLAEERRTSSSGGMP